MGKKVGLDDFLLAHGRDAFDALPALPATTNGHVMTVEAVDVADLVTREFPIEPPLVGGGLIVPRALAVTAGGPKRGKSLYVLNREIRRAQGLPFLGLATTRAGRSTSTPRSLSPSSKTAS